MQTRIQSIIQTILQTTIQIQTQIQMQMQMQIQIYIDYTIVRQRQRAARALWKSLTSKEFWEGIFAFVSYLCSAASYVTSSAASSRKPPPSRATRRRYCPSKRHPRITSKKTCQEIKIWRLFWLPKSSNMAPESNAKRSLFRDAMEIASKSPQGNGRHRL